MGNVTVIGSGHWGIALASVVATNGNNVLVYARREAEARLINTANQSSYFNDIKLNSQIKATTNLEEAINFSDTIVISIPVAQIYDFLSPIVKIYPEKTYLFTSKGLYNGRSMSSLFYEINPNLNLAVLSGPSFAIEVMEEKYTAVVIASDKTEVAKRMQLIFNNKYFRVYTQTDIIGVEICGAIKNVFAIICGMIDGNKMGSNTKNAVITRGISEIQRVIKYMGGKDNTIFGLAGIGDIMLTCNSLESRNYSYGYNYKAGSNLSYNQNGTIEGLNTIKEIYNLATANHIDMPITIALYNILFGNSSIDIEAPKLMKRDMKGE